jgi:hypothetical protein
MFKPFRTIAEPAADALRETGHPPSLHQFADAARWLSAWVEFRIAQAGPGSIVVLPEGAGLRLVTSLFLDTAVSSDGRFWILNEDLSPTWRRATRLESSAILLSAQRRAFPELMCLVPTKPADAQPCASCNGKGFINDVAWCLDCGCLGWTRLSHG